MPMSQSSAQCAAWDTYGRPTKSTPAIVAKLAQETIRLSQMPDIADCRLVVDDAVTQDKVVHGLTSLFDKAVARRQYRRAFRMMGYGQLAPTHPAAFATGMLRTSFC